MNSLNQKSLNKGNGGGVFGDSEEQSSAHSSDPEPGRPQCEAGAYKQCDLGYVTCLL